MGLLWSGGELLGSHADGAVHREHWRESMRAACYMRDIIVDNHRRWREAETCIERTERGYEGELLAPVTPWPGRAGRLDPMIPQCRRSVRRRRLVKYVESSLVVGDCGAGHWQGRETGGILVTWG